MNLSPIVLFVYNRPWHTQQTIKALQKNDLASKSDLYIFSDGKKTNNDIEVSNVRSYIKTITGFKSIKIFERNENWGLAKNIVDGVSSILAKDKTVIVLEDDIVTSEGFLKYMNDALSIHRTVRLELQPQKIDRKNLLPCSEKQLRNCLTH
jgi:GT2 family glycosyltransferase